MFGLFKNFGKENFYLELKEEPVETKVVETQQVTAPVAKEEPVAAIKEEPVAAIKEEPVAAIKEEPVVAIKEEPVVAIKEEPVPAPVVTETPFTPQILVPSRNRRRPGANMKSYLDMASQVKVPR